MDTEHRKGVTRHNERVKKNSSLLMLCSLASQEFLFWDHDESSTPLNKGNFTEFLNVLKNRGPLLENHLNSATVI